MENEKFDWIQDGIDRGRSIQEQIEIYEALRHLHFSDPQARAEYTSRLNELYRKTLGAR